MFKRMIPAVFSLAMVLGLIIPASSVAAKTAPGVFYGTVRHVSTNNIKVEDPKTRETLSFELVPRFKQVFSGDGKTTVQMASVKPGMFVKVIYDQKALGMRHADKIMVQTNGNETVKQMKS